MMRWAPVSLVALCACSSILQIEDTPAQECTTDNDCQHNIVAKTCSQSALACVTTSRVLRADEGLYKRDQPHLTARTLGVVSNGTLLSILCQTRHGDQALDKTEQTTLKPFTTWDLLDDGTWVYDWYMDTPTVNQGYSTGIEPCPGD
jgi:hypothetical protein